MATPPRNIQPGALVEVSRRTIAGFFLLTAHKLVLQTFLYLLAIYTTRFGIKLVGAVMMLNHFHLLMIDEEGNTPSFMQIFDSMLAKFLNRFHKREGTVWCANGYTPLTPVSPQAQLDRFRYLLNNPLAANLIERLKDYPFVCVHEGDILEDLVIERPWFFGKRSRLPKTATLKYHKLPAYEHLDDDAYVAFVTGEIKQAEDRHIAERKRKGVRVMGRKRLQQIVWTQRPKKDRAWFQLRPQIAERDPELRVAAIWALQRFRSRYREALAAWHAGDKDAVFPYGTWKMRLQFGVKVEPAPS